MRIAFFPSGCVDFTGRTLEERPLGGIETAVIRIAQALSDLGAEVIVFSNHQNPPLGRPLYLPHRAIGDLGPVDVLIVVREWRPLFFPIQARARLFWTGDAHDQPQTIGLGDKRIASRIDALLAVSEWHAKNLAAASGFPSGKVMVLPNGFHEDYFTGSETKVRKRLMYSSTPYRGLEHLPGLFKAIQQRHNDAELHVFSGYDVYRSGQSPGAPEQALQQLEQIRAAFSTLPNVHFRGNVLQAELAREYMRSSILAYPNTFAETSCITALEAQAGGCVTVCSQRGALPETVGQSGVTIPGDPGSTAYNSAFIETVCQLLADDIAFETLALESKLQARNKGWRSIAAEFLSFLRDFLNESVSESERRRAV